jgi:hypothetical protein
LVDLLGFVDALADAGLCGLVVDHVGFGDEVVTEVVVSNRPLDEGVLAVAVRGGLARRVDVVFLDA